jgi:hypothetical protein
LKFISDAAGAAMNKKEMKIEARCNYRGIASVGFNGEEINFCSRIRCPFWF